jgi:RNA polymerase sigma-70 factor (ECF subfamily)
LSFLSFFDKKQDGRKQAKSLCQGKSVSSDPCSNSPFRYPQAGRERALAPVVPSESERVSETLRGQGTVYQSQAGPASGIVPVEPRQNLRQGSQGVQEFQTFYQENIHLIYRYIYSKVGNREEAEDLTSQTFTKAVRSIDQERSLLSMQKWLFQIARTTVADYWRVRYRVPVSSLDELLDAGWEGPANEDEDNTQPLVAHDVSATERVQRILAGLPENYRQVLTCRFLLNLSIKETAQRLGLTEGNVKVLQFRALKRAADIETLVSRSGSQ